MAKKFAASLTDAQFRLATAIADAGLTSLSQVVKAFERRDREQIDVWKSKLNAGRIERPATSTGRQRP
jgi:hypothetical protein